MERVPVVGVQDEDSIDLRSDRLKLSKRFALNSSDLAEILWLKVELIDDDPELLYVTRNGMGDKKFQKLRRLLPT